MKFLLQRRNLLAAAIKKAGFLPTDFKVYERDEGPPGIEFRYKETDYKYRAYQDQTPHEGLIYWAVYSPAPPEFSGQRTLKGNDETLAWHFSEWLKVLRDELNTPDELSAPETVPFSEFRPKPDVHDEKFSESQISQITTKMEDLRNHLLTNAPDAAITINVSIDKLNYYAGVLPKIDWLKYAFGAVGYLLNVLNMSPTATARAWKLLHFVASGVMDLVHQVQKLL